MAEILVASALLAVLCIPLLTMSTQSVKRSNDDRARIIAFTLANNALARITAKAAAGMLTKSDPNGPGKVSDNVLVGPLAGDIVGPYGALASAARMKLILRRIPGNYPKYSHLRAEVTFASGISGVSEMVYLETPFANP